MFGAAILIVMTSAGNAPADVPYASKVVQAAYLAGVAPDLCAGIETNGAAVILWLSRFGLGPRDVTDPARFAAEKALVRESISNSIEDLGQDRACEVIEQSLGPEGLGLVKRTDPH